MAFEIRHLGEPQALRVWADMKDIPEATKALLTKCLKQEITPTVITLELVEDQWSIIVWGD